jgi:methionyl-tRNA synthetase
MTDKYYYITTPIYYMSGEVHMGNAYTTIVCDVMARFKRLDGYKVKFLTGTDEHGLKVYQSARDTNVEPQLFCDRLADKFRSVLPTWAITNDDFIRTTETRHKIAAQALWQKMVDKGYIYISKYSGWYAVRDEAYYDGSEITTNAKGEKIAIPSGNPVAWLEEESYFFKLSAFQDRLLDYITENPNFIQPKSRMNEVVSFIKGGLQDLSISRTTFDWGIPVPNDEKHVMYVWIDALTNYLSALGFPEDTDDIKNFWPEATHVVGKDILRFHAVYWPAFLMAVDIKPPKMIYAHGWWTVDGVKMSKSLGNVLYAQDLIAQYGLDQFRYFILREVSFGQDGNFTHEAIQMRMNTELANDFGNLAQRVLSFIYKNAEAKLPSIGTLEKQDIELLDQSFECLAKMRSHMDIFAFHKALDEVWSVIRAANIYVDGQAPWALRKTDLVRMATVLGVLCEVTRRLAIMIQPFMPAAMAQMLDQLAVPQDMRSFSYITKEIGLEQGATIQQPIGVFPRYTSPVSEAVA